MPENLDTVATRFLAERHRLMAFILAGVGNPHGAEDIFQEVWLRFAQAVQAGTVIEDEARWCRATAKNLLLHHWRSERRAIVEANSDLLEVLELLDTALAAAPALEADVASERQQALQECLARLPETPRRLLALKYEAGRSIAAIAAETGQSSAAISKSLTRLRQNLMQCVQSRLKLDALGL